jgi:hypothetical protein
MARLSNHRITECVLAALARTGGPALPADWRSLDPEQRADAPFDAGKLTGRGRDELIHAIRRELRGYAAYCPIEPAHLDKSRSVRDLIAFVEAHHTPIP